MTASLAYWVIAFLLGVLGGTILYIALFADRARGRLRCPKCWYDMQGADPASPLRCPECGNDAKREKRLSKTRRRWRLAFVGVIVLIAAGVSALQPKVQRDGWASIVPTAVLVYAMPLTDHIDVLAELQKRSSTFHEFGGPGFGFYTLEQSKLTDRQWRALLEATLQRVHTESDPNRRMLLVNWLGQSRHLSNLDDPYHERVRRALVDMTSDGNVQVEGDALRWLAMNDPSSTIDLLLPMLKSDTEQRRLNAITTLGSLLYDGQHCDVIDPLLGALDDASATNRRFALSVLTYAANCPDDVARVIAAVERLADDPDIDVRGLRIKTIATLLEPDESDAYIADMLASDAVADRAGAMAFIAWPVDIAERHLPHVIRGLNDDHQLVRHWAAEAIKFASNDLLAPHRDAITAAADHSDPSVATAARAVLSRLSRN